MWPFSKPASKPRTLEESLQIFESSGVSMRPGITIENLLVSYDRQKYENDARLLAIHLGSDVEEPPFSRISDRLWHFDTECIEDHGAYVAIAERMRDLASPYLPIADIPITLTSKSNVLSFRS